MKDFSKINERILYIIENKTNGNKRRFSERIGFAPQVVFNIVSGRKTKPSFDVLEAIITSFDDISSEWLLTGRGRMLRDHTPEDPHIYNKEDPPIEAIPLKFAQNKENKPIPLVNISAAAGFGSDSFLITEQDVKEYYVVPKFKYLKVDFMIEIHGSSMYPKYNSGDIVACTILHDRKFIQWNKCHVIATREQGLICKRLLKSEHENCLSAVSDNRQYPPFDIPTDEITGIALVVGVIRLE